MTAMPSVTGGFGAGGYDFDGSTRVLRIVRSCATVHLLPLGKEATVAVVNPPHTLCRHAPEYWPGIARNAGPACSGITGRHQPESAMLQAGVNVKVAQTLAGHHSTAFTLDVYADALPHQIDEAGEKVADILIGANGSHFGSK
jgi:hypothetical protein